jgi:hypothetical protein
VNILNGNGASGQNSRKEHCSAGHAFDSMDRRGRRTCRTCIRVKQRERRQRLRAAA